MAVQRAVKRDLLTGEPIRSDTLHIRVRTLDVDRPEPVVEHQRYHAPQVRQREMLPDLSEMLDDTAGDGDADA